jgi:hypothetical protein
LRDGGLVEVAFIVLQGNRLSANLQQEPALVRSACAIATSKAAGIEPAACAPASAGKDVPCAQPAGTGGQSVLMVFSVRMS